MTRRSAIAKIPFIKSRNFDTPAVARTAMMADLQGMVLTGFVMGHAQALRDALSKHFGPKFKGLVLTSTNRAEYNSSVGNAATNSHHIWRVDPDGQLHVAYDCKPMGITLDELYNFAVKFCRGEIYLNRNQGIVHIAPVGMEDEHWIQ